MNMNHTTAKTPLNGVARIAARAAAAAGCLLRKAEAGNAPAPVRCDDGMFEVAAGGGSVIRYGVGGNGDLVMCEYVCPEGRGWLEGDAAEKAELAWHLIPA